MATNTEPGSVPTTAVLEGLNDLLQLNHDALGAYSIAIEKLEDRDHASQISGFRLDHERHVRELTGAIERLGGTPKNEPHATGPLKEGMQSLGALGGDKGILLAWRTNELQVRTKYDSYASLASQWPQDLKRMIDEQALDEERHYRWVADVLERMGVAPGEGMETRLAGRAREQMGRVREQVGGLTDRAQELKARAQELPGRAREQAGAAAETARQRAADGLERAADRLDGMADRQAEAGGARGRAAGAAHRVAGGMTSTADYLRTSEPGMLRQDIEQQARTNPVRTLITAFGIGFVIGRILR